MQVFRGQYIDSITLNVPTKVLSENLGYAVKKYHFK